MLAWPAEAAFNELNTFMIKSGRKVPTPEIPMPDFAVPNAAPIPNGHRQQSSINSATVVFTSKDHCEGNTSLQKLSVTLCSTTSSLSAHQSEERRKLRGVIYVFHDESSSVPARQS